MLALARSLIGYVERHFAEAVTRDPDGPVRPVLVGPPSEALREMFGILTANGQREWRLSVVNANYDVVVLLVDEESPPTGATLSRGCHWDYAVTIRNSCLRALILTARASWDKRPESLANTTETLGDVGGISREEDNLQGYLNTAVATQLGILERQVQELVRIVRAESARLEPAARDAMCWDVFDNLLARVPATSPADAACYAAGFPVIGTSGMSIKDSYDVLCSLAKFISSDGLSDAIDQMKGTNAAQTLGVLTDLDSLQQHLGASLLSPTAFETAPSRHFRINPVPAWYNALTAKVLEEILKELNRSQPQDRLNLTCVNGLANAQPLRGGPYIVLSAPELHASSAAGAAPPVVNFSRKVDRTASVYLPPVQTTPFQCLDSGPPIHRKPIKYKAEALNYRAGTVDVLALDSFACGGIVVVRDAESNGIPTYAARANSWTQELTLTRGGATELLVFHGARAAEVSLARAGEAPTVQPIQTGNYFVSFTEDLEDNDSLEVHVTDAAGIIIGKWILQVAIESIDEVSNSRLEALIAQHRNRRKSIPHAPDIPIHRLELGSYFQSPESWKPVLACWTSRIPSRLAIDWDADAVLGNIRPQIDPRPSINPPAPLLGARESVRRLFQQEQRCTSEIEIDNPTLVPSIEDYLRRYLEWIRQDSKAACWLDVFAIHAAEWNAQAGHHVASDEPVVVLLSPLHPLRLAWHAVAQRQLSESLQYQCSAAGLVSPLQCPDSGILYLSDGQSQKPRAFFSLPCQHPHWVVLANVTFLDKPVPRTSVTQRLCELGLMVEGITGGFTSQQTQDSLNEVNRLLPARMSLRVGVVGEAEISSECGDGVFRWSDRQLAQDSTTATGCLELEVFDTRGATDPSPEQLADLSERTAEHVRWFKLPSASDVPRLDLTIIDQLGARSPEATNGSTRSVVAPACLFRVRVREDFQNARSIVESRVMSARSSGAQLSSLLTETVQEYENLSASDGGRTHFHFTPNQDAVGSRLQNSIFLSVTSSQVDPACIVRGTVGQGGYLWDYELPGLLAGNESSLGYYLVARPTSAMEKAVENAALLVASFPPNVPGLLEEVSRRGIPILKRLASGGSQSRGELGLLLATRLLQDSFRSGATFSRLPVWSGNCIHLVLPVDPYEELFTRLRRELLPAPSSGQRPDLIVVAIQLANEQQPISIKLTPVEVKYRAAGMSATDMREALTQAQTLGRLLEALWIKPANTELWKTCGTALLAQFLDFGFRIYAADWLHQHQHSEWARTHQQVLRDVLEGTARVTVNVAGRLLLFHGSLTTMVADLDGDNRQDTIIVSLDDARALLAGTMNISATGNSSVQQLDFSFPDCTSVPTATTPPSPTVPSTSGSSETLTSPPATVSQPEGSAPRTNPAGDAGTVAAPLSHPVDVPVSPPAGPSRIPTETRRRVQEAFEGFIGNEPAVSRLSNDLLRALIEQPPHLAKNYLFTGLPSTGKTELARRIARVLDLPFIKLDGRSVASREKLFDLIDGELRTSGLSASQVGQRLGLPVLEYPPLIVFIDEVHLVPRALQESLLTMLEAADRTVVLSNQVAHMHRATFLFATTRASDVDAAFTSRCDEIQLREYTDAEVAQILKWKLPHDEWPDDVYQALSRIGRCVPRISIQLAGALETAVLVSEEEKPLLGHLNDVRRAREIDERGLTRMDFEYLAILERAGGPVGEQNILNLMRTVDKDRVLNEIEPFLVRLDFILHGPRGRELTNGGREYLLAHRLAEPRHT
jgi:DNA phosphorothioation-dependent restriction protein DptH